MPKVPEQSFTHEAEGCVTLVWITSTHGSMPNSNFTFRTPGQNPV